MGKPWTVTNQKIKPPVPISVEYVGLLKNVTG